MQAFPSRPLPPITRILIVKGRKMSLMPMMENWAQVATVLEWIGESKEWE
jgi:hypothetical protein